LGHPVRNWCGEVSGVSETLSIDGRAKRADDAVSAYGDANPGIASRKPQKDNTS
jgi:hypothetical protein